MANGLTLLPYSARLANNLLDDAIRMARERSLAQEPSTAVIGAIFQGLVALKIDESRDADRAQRK